MSTIPSSGGVGFTHSKFIICKLEPRGDRTEKMPCNAQGIVSSLHTADRMTLEEAQQLAASLGANYRAGVIMDGDGRFCIDIDGALVDNAWSQLATELCTTFAGCYVEVSQSGKGLHIFGYSASIPPHASKNVPLHIELYSDNRFICLGQSGQGDMFFDAAAPLNAVVSRYFPAQEQTTAAEWTTTHVPQSSPLPDDDKLIAKACAATSAAGVFGARGTFKDLWQGDTTAYEGDASSADAALAQHLAFWAGNNCERIERLMRLSALKRDKWDNHKSYMQRTILGAVSRQTNWYSVGAPIETVPLQQVVEASEPVAKSGFQFIGGTQLADMFRGCVYVGSINRILTPSGVMMKQEQFNITYGGYTFTLDDSNEKTTRKAWEAFTESQLYTFSKVQDVTFNPDTPFGSITTEGDLKYVNAFKPYDDMGKPGNVDIFITHIKKMLPHDHNILLDWMAVKTQQPGKCMKWAPVIIGPFGNGKTTIADAMMMINGNRHSALVQSSDVDNKFNGWVYGNTLAVINDFKVGDKRDVIEILKPIITDRTIAYQKKGEESGLCRNMLGVMITSNYRDAVMKTKDDRRYCTLISPHEDKADILRDGMDEEYFARLDAFMSDNNSAHYLRHYFMTREVAHYPHRAPDTSNTALAIDASLGSIEQEIMEAIDEGRQGFAGGWVSSKALDLLLKTMRAERQVPPARRRDMMRSLGYDWHPGLKDGRVNNVILMDGGKPRLYIKQGHIHVNLTTPAEIARCYQAAQGDPVAAAQMMG